jgi:hypothetical protein
MIVGPQRDIGQWLMQDIVQLTAYQRPGAGSATVTGTVQQILEEYTDDEVEFGFDDTLIGAGSGGTDAILFVMPEVRKPTGPDPNTNAFGELMPGFNDNVVMYSDVQAPIEIPTPMPMGAIDILSEMRATSGWVPRPEGVLVLSASH